MLPKNVIYQIFQVLHKFDFNSRLAALASSDEEEVDDSRIEVTSNDYEDLDTSNATSNAKSETNSKKIRANIAQRKKLATPSPSHHGGNGSRASLDESLYSSLSNEVYSKIQSPPPPLLSSR